MTPRPLSNHHVFVTGSSHSIGLVIAAAFLSRGCSITLNGRNPTTLAAARDTLLSQHRPIQHHASPTHTNIPSISPPPLPTPLQSRLNPKSTSSFTQPATEKTPEIHLAPGDISNPSFWTDLPPSLPLPSILINSASLSHSSILPSTSPELTSRIISTNLTGTILGSRYALRSFIRHRVTDGVIVNVASLMGVKGGQGCSVYAASKAGLIGFTRALAGEMNTGAGGGRGRVNVVVPGWVEGGMTDCKYSPVYASTIWRYCLLVPRMLDRAPSFKGEQPTDDTSSQ